MKEGYRHAASVASFSRSERCFEGRHHPGRAEAHLHQHPHLHQRPAKWALQRRWAEEKRKLGPAAAIVLAEWVRRVRRECRPQSRRRKEEEEEEGRHFVEVGRGSARKGRR